MKEKIVKLSDGQTEVLVKDFKRIQSLKHAFEKTMAEGRKWSDQDRWLVAADHFANAARQARDIAAAVKVAESYTRNEKKATAKGTNDFEPMDISLAVFNGHVNDGFKKANKAFAEKFGREVFDREIKPLHAEGIMVIFQKPPTEFTKWYAEKVQSIVNDGRPYVGASEKSNK